MFVRTAKFSKSFVGRLTLKSPQAPQLGVVWQLEGSGCGVLTPSYSVILLSSLVQMGFNSAIIKVTNTSKC